MDATTKTKNEYSLTIAIHRGTITSRDIEQPKAFDTKEAAVKELDEARESYKSLGYQIWYATLTNPDGTKETLESNPYQR